MRRFGHSFQMSLDPLFPSTALPAGFNVVVKDLPLFL
jgi:hypothetical protein